MRSHRVLLFLVLAVAMPWHPSTAGATGPAFPVADLTEGNATAFFDPHFLALFDGSMYLVGRTEASGRELWRTDGTPEGTELVADLCGGPCDSMGIYSLAAAVFDGALYFPACAETDCRLWKTDGEHLSPVLVGIVRDIVVWDGSLFFTTGQGDLRRLDADGSSELLHHFDGLTPLAFLETEGALFVTAWDPSFSVMVDPSQIWRTDGTPEGTFFILESPNHAPFPFLLDGKAVFLGLDQRLWVSDSFGAAPLLEEPPFSAPEPVAAIDDVLFVRAEDRALWGTDGTPEGTFVVAEPAPGAGLGFESVAYRGELYFFFGAASRVLHRTSGLAAAEVFVELPEPASRFQVLDETLFIGTGFPLPVSLWRTTGTPESTSRVFANAPDSFLDLAAFGDTLLVHLRGPGDSRLGRFADGDDRVVALSPSAGGASSFFLQILRHRDGVVFEGDLHAWWRSDGSAPGTERLPGGFDFFRGGAVALGDEAFLLTSSGFMSVDDDGQLVPLFGRAQTGSVVPGVLEPTPEGLLFLTTGFLSGRHVHLWIGDRESGEAAIVVPDLQDFTNILGEVETARLDGGDVLLFIEGVLWRTDGTAEGTRRLLDVSDDCADCELREAVSAGSRIFFESSGLADPTPRLWRTDGTPEGTVLVRSFPPGDGGSWLGLRDLTALGERLFFVITAPESGRELWTSDGTAAGTRLVRDVWQGGDASPSDLTPMDGRLVFVADDGVRGRELWTSDGTARGTALFLDLFPGPRSSHAQELTVIDGRLVFAADDGVHGLELWASDGTPRGTRLLHDLNPGLQPSDPRLFTAAGELVYFSAGDEELGYELRAVARDALFEDLAAAFAASRERTVQAKPVTFSDTSAGRPDAWCWRFGDEGEGAPRCSATTPVARHRFLEPGRYTVELTVERRLPSGIVENDRTSLEVAVGAICRRCGTFGND